MTLRVIKEVVSKVSQGARSTATLGYVGALLQSAKTDDAPRHP